MMHGSSCSSLFHPIRFRARVRDCAPPPPPASSPPCLFHLQHMIRPPVFLSHSRLERRHAVRARAPATCILLPRARAGRAAPAALLSCCCQRGGTARAAPAAAVGQPRSCKGTNCWPVPGQWVGGVACARAAGGGRISPRETRASAAQPSSGTGGRKLLPRGGAARPFCFAKAACPRHEALSTLLRHNLSILGVVLYLFGTSPSRHIDPIAR